MRATLPVIVVLMVAAGCARSALISGPIAAPRLAPPCSDCDSIPMPREIARAIEARIADLAARGGDCGTYGAVLEQTYRSGRITVRPYMWRVGAHLTSGEAHPDGEIAFAQEIDSLNIGVRTISEMTWSAEHEAVHLAFHIPSHTAEDETQVNGHVLACRPTNAAPRG
jgi:hypothetical protein